ncbi:EI24 domain-containing protein [Actinocorallia longicatena]|uniref:EI24 domain-containing protein n=1 Tax=Actinocorallia longicatena TaxID=111803 RepID=A0ABP6QF85_9ACTN
MKDVLLGARFLGRGLAWCAARPKQWLFGLIPALVSMILFTGLLVLLAYRADDVAGWLTPFADDWSKGARESLRLLTGVLLFGVGAFLSVLLFTAVTLLIGQPFYEALAVRVEESEGGAPPDPGTSLWLQIVRAIRDGIVLAAIALVFAVVFFALGFIPVVGQTVVPVVAACVSGFFLCGELTSIALDRRGLVRKERFALLRAHRASTVGFGALTVVIFLIPLGAVLFMPVAVAGATLYSRHLSPYPAKRLLPPDAPAPS